MSTEHLIELQPKTAKIKEKIPKLDTEENDKKKITTKMMIVNALKELKNRKGTSLYAIKKYLEEEYHVNPDKSRYLIKKSIKTGIEEGIFVQVKGIGASGSFKLGKEEKVKKPKKKKLEEPKSKKEEQLKPKMNKKTEKSTSDKVKKTKAKKDDSTPVKKPKITKETTEKKGNKEKPVKRIKEGRDKKKSEGSKDNRRENKKTVKTVQTPAKKKSLMKRKSIGSIIKPPKMKPKNI